jgi:hypothetical protein
LILNILPHAWPGWATGAGQIVSWLLFGATKEVALDGRTAIRPQCAVHHGVNRNCRAEWPALPTERICPGAAGRPHYDGHGAGPVTISWARIALHGRSDTVSRPFRVCHTERHYWQHSGPVRRCRRLSAGAPADDAQSANGARSRQLRSADAKRGGGEPRNPLSGPSSRPL